jgi:hypothetical protein
VVVEQSCHREGSRREGFLLLLPVVGIQTVEVDLGQVAMECVANNLATVVDNKPIGIKARWAGDSTVIHRLYPVCLKGSNRHSKPLSVELALVAIQQCL